MIGLPEVYDNWIDKTWDLHLCKLESAYNDDPCQIQWHFYFFFKSKFFMLQLMIWTTTQLWRCVLDTTLCDKVRQLLATGRWFPSGTLFSSTNKTDRRDITEMLLKVALSTISLDLNQTFYESTIIRGLVLQLIHNYYSVLYKHVNVSYFLDFFFPVWSKWRNTTQKPKTKKLNTET
jgi:hypothetical protein